MKITIAIPNYNGRDLLEKNLPNIIQSGADEVLVIDDGSTDESLELLSKLKIQNVFQTAYGRTKFKILENKKNLGFIPSVNKLFKEATGEIVVLLNNDVFVEANFLNPLLGHFEGKNVFAVNCHEKGEGPSISFWKNGFFEYKRGEEKNIVQKSAWASGGSAAFLKEIWQELGGFDDLFAPFYFEDTDISFRALKLGYKILWEPKSEVWHQHETTISKTVSKRYKNWVVERNLLLFIWKNITDKKLLTDHKINLFKRLFTFSKLGYWIPFIWALALMSTEKRDRKYILSDKEVINYAQT